MRYTGLTAVGRSHPCQWYKPMQPAPCTSAAAGGLPSSQPRCTLSAVEHGGKQVHPASRGSVQARRPEPVLSACVATGDRPQELAHLPRAWCLWQGAVRAQGWTTSALIKRACAWTLPARCRRLRGVEMGLAVRLRLGAAAGAWSAVSGCLYIYVRVALAGVVAVSETSSIILSPIDDEGERALCACVRLAARQNTRAVLCNAFSVALWCV